ncbi:cardiolipin synthase [Aureimonas fodinaquatilis]|uniref:Cardiolipin synthase n=2 Tax=Aureimonas fodinaquatilis TaxID=2565783 RepID=A0A5B0DRL4_9HYPH|nr:cardiolipin synthase [Aureimonas fodinaquatilis]
MLGVAPMRRSPDAARSWLLLVFFLPVVGLILFLLIGRPSFPPWRGARFARAEQGKDRLVERLRPLIASGLPRREMELTSLANRVGAYPAVSGNQIEWLEDYDATIDRLVADIQAARREVNILVYIFANDSTGQKVIDALAAAAARGVTTRVLIDALGSRRWMKDTLKALRAGGVDAREMLPLRLLHDRTRGDMRNHRKLYLIDGEIGYAGSQNIVARDFKPGVVNRELVVRITGPAVAEMSAIFHSDWYLETEEALPEPDISPPHENGSIAQLLPSGADYPVEGFETLLVSQINSARSRVIITTPYLIPDEALMNALRTAALRGVEVHLIVSLIADQVLVGLAQRSYYAQLIRIGVEIHQYRDYLLHAKHISIDGRVAIVGSSNVDIRSFQLNAEVSVLLFDAEDVAGLEAIQDAYMANSERVDPNEWQNRPRIRKLLENWARLISPLL